jgi:hypothetical protein
MTGGLLVLYSGRVKNKEHSSKTQEKRHLSTMEELKEQLRNAQCRYQGNQDQLKAHHVEGTKHSQHHKQHHHRRGDAPEHRRSHDALDGIRHQAPEATRKSGISKVLAWL